MRAISRSLIQPHILEAQIVVLAVVVRLDVFHIRLPGRPFSLQPQALRPTGRYIASRRTWLLTHPQPVGAHFSLPNAFGFFIETPPVERNVAGLNLSAARLRGES